jgi:chaperonin cofactor prefoldin
MDTLELIVNRLDRIENKQDRLEEKIDKLNAFRYKAAGAQSALYILAIILLKVL